VGALFEREKQPHRRAPALLAVAGVCLLASLGSVVLSATSPVWKQVRQAEQARTEEAERRRLDSE
jgi:hypothetical protein